MCLPCMVQPAQHCHYCICRTLLGLLLHHAVPVIVERCMQVMRCHTSMKAII
jgi:hypothetical protein